MLLYTENEITQAPVVEERTLRSILAREYGIVTGIVHRLTGYEDCNFRLSECRWEERSDGPNEVIVKITNPIEAKDVSVIDAQYEVFSLLRSARIPTPEGIKTKAGEWWTLQELGMGVRLPVRVFRLLPGVNLENFDFTPDLVTEIGRTLASVHRTLDGFPHDISHVPFISPENVQCMRRETEILYRRKLIDDQKKALVDKTFADLDENIFRRRNLFDEGIIHSDFNETNLLVKDGKISGVLDFGDMHISLRVFDVAAAILYLHLSDRLGQRLDDLAAHFVAGYRSARAFVVPNDSLLVAMRARMACSLIYGLRTARINYRGGSIDYVLKTQSNGWETLQRMSARYVLKY
ncbi:hypothetical protein PRIPAC_90092 [Pristionchus pacificus]|uniref:Hydroxylysine kinase n=1 Tax=Pristionchus pacificus TaxID=54126 RepID=A0A2A6CWN0_PRIPA|nr:hypothetical protein PRIPAC_90092 [Pristionchus pacificus]|eukprot:PDM82457.1 phosphotransferase [Pristionchus pacificus]